MVLLSMFIGATPVDAASKTVGFSGFIGACLLGFYCSVVDCFNLKSLFLEPPPPVINK